MCGSASELQAEYRGSVSVTRNGIKCQHWASQEPHTHKHTLENFPNAGLEENFCRNPDGSQMAWCYSSDPLVRWDYCDVPYCNERLDCGTAALDQTDYRGSISVTESGKVCQNWTSQEPHPHKYTPASFPAAGLEDNHCRNPSGEARAWCFTSDPEDRWEFCNVNNCEE